MALISSQSLDEAAIPVEALRQRVADLEAALAISQTEIATLNQQLAQERAEQARVDASLREQQRMMNGIFEHAPIGIQVYDRNGFSLRMNEAQRALLGLPDVSYGVGQFNALTDPFFIATGSAALFQRAYAGEVVHEPARQIDLGWAENTWQSHGRDVWFEHFLFPVFDDDGTVAVVVALAKDVSDRHQALEELKQTTSLLEGLFQHVPIGIQIYDYDGVSLRMNEAQRALLGLPDVTYGVGSYNIRTDSCATDIDFTAVFDRARAGDVIRLPELGVDLGHPSNQWSTIRQKVVLDYLVFPIRNAKGEVAAVATCVLDISARVRAEAEVERLQMERKLLESQRLHSLGVLTGGIAHDFNNLLAGIIGYAQLALLDLAPDTPAQPNLKAVITVAQRAADLTQQLLAYTGKGHVAMQGLDLATLIHEMGELLQVSSAHQCVIRYHLTPSLPNILADAAQIRQVVLNLLINAAEAIGETGGIIEVGTSLATLDAAELQGLILGGELTPGTYVALTVRDSGSGMDEATLARIFEPFFTTKFTGRGLGLAAVQGIVRVHRGAMRVRSAPGQGSCFEIWFPVPNLEPAVDTRPQVPPATVPLGGTVLVIDDEEMVRTTTARLLERLGYTVVKASDGPAGIEQLCAGIPGLVGVVIDLTMPHMMGDAVAQAIHVLVPSMPIILMSGYSAEEVARHCADIAIAGFLQKPFTFDTLREVVCQALDHR